MSKKWSLAYQAPKTATHYGLIGAHSVRGGETVAYIGWFRFTNKKLEVFYTDNDNEYPCWRPVDERNYHHPETVAREIVKI